MGEAHQHAVISAASAVDVKSTTRRPKRSAITPPESVPRTPAARKPVSIESPTAGEPCSTSTTYTGTNATNPKYAIARTVTNAESLPNDTQSSAPWPLRDVAWTG